MERFLEIKESPCSVQSAVAPAGLILKTDLQFFNLPNSTAVDQWEDYVLNEGDEFVPRMWVKPLRLMLRLGLEY